MGCFSACFGSSKKHSKSKKHETSTSPNKDQNLCQSHEINQALLCTNQTAEESQIASPVKIIAEIEGANEEQLNTSFRKKVTFDLLLKTSEECQAQEEAKALIENEQKEKREEIKDNIVQDLLSDSTEKSKKEQNKAEADLLSDSTEKSKKEENKDEGDLLSDSTVSSLFTYPSNCRYKNCASSDDECVDMDFNNDVVDINHNDKNGCEDLVQEESSESLFSISIESRKQNSAAEMGEKEVSSPLKPQNARDRSLFVHSVLNPIENLSQWKASRSKTTSSMKNQENIKLEQEEEFTMPSGAKGIFNLDQENVIPFSEEPTLKQTNEQRSKRFSNGVKNGEVEVDTSLSSWLLGSEKSPGSVGNSSSSKRTKSPKSFEDRPILGVLTVEDLKQMSKSATPSPRRSPSHHSPDEMPIIGTVGSYWRRTGETMDADTYSSGKGTSGASCKSRQCRKGGKNGHSTPFQARLERAVDAATAQV
ncbi:hypothetical protein ACH5RR_019148 [Cinchona calisaya]|uniref:Uncharacterized protein n=1 Tax=Cinchona calisaya TaxID=153742 RepID=A0ABD2ZPH4_9GENT